jgi:transposase
MARPPLKAERGLISDRVLMDAIFKCAEDAPFNPYLIIWDLLHGAYPNMSRREYSYAVRLNPRKLRRLIHRWNEEGMLGLCNRPNNRSGRPRKMTRQIFEEKLQPILAQMNARNSGRFSGAALHRRVTQELGIKVGYSTLMRYLQRNRSASRYRGI